MTTQTVSQFASMTWTLEDAVANRRWQRVSYPFDHVVAECMFTDRFYRAFEAAVTERLGLFTRDMPDYDASGYAVTSAEDGALALFHSRPWHDLVARAMGVEATGDVNIALHHHEPGGANGSIHNDLNPGWFVGEDRPDGITVADSSRCGYWHGDDAVGPTYERIRAVAVLVYVGNEVWQPGDGGETGLYLSRSQAVDEPAVRVPPRNNTLLAFECTPTSYHSFVSNRRIGRTSLIQWLHRSRDEVVARWGGESIVGW